MHPSRAHATDLTFLFASTVCLSAFFLSLCGDRYVLQYMNTTDNSTSWEPPAGSLDESVDEIEEEVEEKNKEDALKKSSVAIWLIDGDNTTDEHYSYKNSKTGETSTDPTSGWMEQFDDTSNAR